MLCHFDRPMPSRTCLVLRLQALPFPLPPLPLLSSPPFTSCFFYSFYFLFKLARFAPPTNDYDVQVELTYWINHSWSCAVAFNTLPLSLSLCVSACTFNQLKGHASLAHCAVCASIKQSPECGRRGSGCNNSHISSLSCMLKTINYYLQKVNFYLETNKQRVRGRSTQLQRRRHQVWQQHTYT